jgi:hypothetical protein
MPTMSLLPMLLLATLVLMLAPTSSRAAEVTFPDLEAAVPGHKDISYLDLAQDIVLDLAKANGVYQGHVVIDVRHIGGPDDASSQPETINLPGVAALPIRSDGRDRLLLLLDFGDAADSANGFAVLALYDLSSAERLLDAANVAYDRSTWFREGASLAVSADTDAVITMSEHFSSSQGYVTSALILPRDDRLELIDTIFTFNEQLCEYKRQQVPSFKTVDAAGSAFASIEAVVTETTTPSDESCEGQKPAPATRTITVTYKWDDAASRYAPDSDALKKLAVENQQRF